MLLVRVRVRVLMSVSVSMAVTMAVAMIVSVVMVAKCSHANQVDYKAETAHDE